jgi:AbrB family looped-hinge helix DNA binding protein
MVTVKLSPKFQVVIPRSVRTRLGSRPGMRLQVIEYEGRVEFLPVRKPSDLKGFLGRIDTSIPREGDRL